MSSEPQGVPLATTATPQSPNRLPNPSELRRLVFIANAMYEAEMKGSLVGPRAYSPHGYFLRLLVGWANGVNPIAAASYINCTESGINMRTALKLWLARQRGATLDLVETTMERAVVRVHRPDWPADRSALVEYTVADAERAQLLAKATYKRYLDSMLVHRAMAKACNLYLGDLTLAAGYTVAEIEDLPDGIDEAGLPEFVGRPAGGAAPAAAAPVPEAPVAGGVSAAGSPTDAAPAPSSALPPPPPSLAPADEPEALRSLIRALVHDTGITKPQWVAFCSREYGGRSLADWTPDDLRSGADRLRAVHTVHRCRDVLQITPEQWTAALAKRGVAHAIELSLDALQELGDRLWERMTPWQQAQEQGKPHPFPKSSPPVAA